MKLTISLADANKQNDDIGILKNFIAEHSLKGTLLKIPERKMKDGAMNGGDLLPIIEMIIKSTASAALIKGVFDILKKYFDLKKAKLTTMADIEKARIEANKVQLKLENKGKKIQLTLHSDDDERTVVFEKIDKFFGD